MKTITVGIKRVGEPVKLMKIEDSLKSYKDIVGGYIEAVPITNQFLLICNEEGKLNGLSANFRLGDDVIVGDVFFVRSNGEDFESITEFDAAYLEEMFR